MTHTTHLLAGRNGTATECNTKRAKFGVGFPEFGAIRKADGESSCKRCEAAYQRRLAAASARRAA